MNFSFDKFVGFDNNKEYLPNIFDTFDSKEKIRQLFLNMSNNILKCVCSFSKYEQKKLSKYPLKFAFEYKIKTLLPYGFMVKSYKKNDKKVFDFCLNSTKIIEAFLNNKTIPITNKSNLKVAKLISHCYINKNLQLLIDKDLLFHEFVLKKIKKQHKDKDVLDLGDAIVIKTEESYGLKILTSWKNIEVKNPDIKNELESAIKTIKKGEFYQIYLVYPKTENFTKQIPVYVDELKNKEYQIKAIPYSLRSAIRN